jgi:hypothetical protein
MSSLAIDGPLNNFRRGLKLCKYNAAIDYQRVGSPQQLLPVLHYILLDYSPHLSSYFLDKFPAIAYATDEKFIETVFKIMRVEFQYLPVLKPNQFFTGLEHFVVHKIKIVSDLIFFCRRKHNDFVKIKRKQNKKSSNSLPSSSYQTRPRINETTQLNREDRLCLTIKKCFAQLNSKIDNVEASLNERLENLETRILLHEQHQQMVSCSISAP